MRASNSVTDKSIRGPECRWTVVAQEITTSRKLFLNGHHCPLLAQFNIEHVGIMNAYQPYLKGEGLGMIDGKWVKIRAGEACIFPPHVTNAFKANNDENWEFAWVRYVEPPDKKSVANTQSPTLSPYRSNILKENILSLIDELENSPSQQVLACWVNLIHQQVQKFVGPQRLDERLFTMLREVTKDLSRNWSLIELAEIANLSDEHLRRLCNEQLGRSPKQQITFLRLSHAKNLIIQTDDPIESIALKVGYKSQFSFSNAFKKWIGCRPSALR